jgi:hypothetical protein
MAVGIATATDTGLETPFLILYVCCEMNVGRYESLAQLQFI